LPRPHALLDAMKAKLEGNAPPDYDRRVREAVADCVRRQAEAGIDIVSDGEQSKPGFFSYVRERLAGFEPRADHKVELFPAEVRAFPEYYEQYFKEAMLGGAIARFAPLVCAGPVSYRSTEPLRRDIDNL
jgi:5-methyltetrahydropteroyltriglutamate--homocysteine methyltransferase